MDKDKAQPASENPYFGSEPTSGFVRPADFVNSNEFTEFTDIPSSGIFLLARAKRQGRWWVLKGLKEEYREDSVYRALLQKEYEITIQLQHPMVVFASSLEEVEGRGLCIVMEWIDGITLSEWLAQDRSRRFPASDSQTKEEYERPRPQKRERRHVADMLLVVLAYVHSRQTQHRDLKPSNIMLTHNGQCLKLIDFGLSDTDSHAILKAPAGTEGYMAPEGPSDIYSLGCILRELRLGWLSQIVVRKCCAPLDRRYTNVANVQRDLHRCWQWPQRLLFIFSLAIVVITLYLMNLSQTQHSPQSFSDSLNVLREEKSNMISSEQIKPDSLQHQINHLNEQINHLNGQRQEEQAAASQRQSHIDAAKRQIDKQLQATGIQQMFDTVSCKRNIKIPFLRITDELIRDTKEPELKEYIQERYRKPWIKRMAELPF